MAPDDHDGLLEDLKLDEELEGFLNGTTPTSGMVNLSPSPVAFGSPTDAGAAGAASASATGGFAATAAQAGGEGGRGTAAAAVGAAAAAMGSAAAALMGGNFAAAQDVIGGAVGNAASAAVPTSLQPVKETAGRFLSKAQPWRDFLLPMSVPPASDGCSRLTANIYNFQTNYAILFVLQLVLGIILQPSALICIIMIVVVWVFFLKKNEDPGWVPVLGGVQLGPIQRWLLLAAATTLVLLFVAGGAIINNTFMFVVFAFCHGIFHDASTKGIPGSAAAAGEPVPL